MRKIYIFCLALTILFGTSLNAQEKTPLWEFIKAGFSKYYYESEISNNVTNGEKTYFNNKFYVKESYKGLPSNNVNAMVKDSKGNHYFGFNDYFVKYDGKYWTVYTSENSNFKGKVTYDESNITELKVDSDDNIWISTLENGLMKFDGTDFTTYNTENSSLPSNRISDIDIDKNGNIWLAMPTKGVAKFDRKTTWTAYNKDNTNFPETSLAADNISYCIAIDGNNKLWVANNRKNTGEFAVAKFDGTSTWNVYSKDNSDIPDNDVVSLATDKDGNVWFASHSRYGHLGMINKDTEKVYDYSDEAFGEYIWGYTTLAADKLGNVYAANNLGVTKLNISSKKFTKYSSYNTGVPYIDKNNNVYFTRKNGVYTIEGEKAKLIYSEDYNATINFTGNLKLDSKGNIWGKTAKGIQKYDGKNWTFLSLPDFCSFTGSVSAFGIDSKDNVYVTYKVNTYNYGFAKFDGKKWIELKAGQPFSPKGLTIDNNDNVWIGSWGHGIAKYDGTNWTVYNSGNSKIIGDYIERIETDKLGNVWADCFDGPMKIHSLAKYSGDKFEIFTDKNTGNAIMNNSHSNFTSFASDKNGDVYFGYGGEEKGFIKYNGTSWNFFDNSNFNGDYVQDIAVDDNGNVWVSSLDWVIGKGGTWYLAKYDGTRFNHYDTKELGMSNHSIYSLLFDNKGNLFMLNDRRLVKHETGEIANTCITNKTFEQYLINDGHDTNSDGIVSCEEAKNIKTLNLIGRWSNNIQTIEGIEKLTNLEVLKGRYWNFKTVDLTSNTKLKHVSIATSTSYSTTGITSLDVSTCVDLEYLLIYADLTNLDLSNNTKLKHLNCDNNEIVNLDIKNSNYLTYLSCVGNKLADFDISKNINLDTLRCGNNDFSKIGFDISNNTKLKYLNVNAGNLSTIDLSKNTLLETVYCGTNNLTYLDLNKLTKLKYLYCSKNKLKELYTFPSNSVLETLVCRSNGMSVLNLDDCLQLKDLMCSDNNFTNLDVTNNLDLESLSCDSNPLKAIDLTNNTKLEELLAYRCQLNSLDLSNNKLLETLYCKLNNLKELDLSNNTKLIDLRMSDNDITEIDLSQNSELLYLTAENTKLNSLSIAHNFKIEQVNIGTNNLFSTICIGNEGDYVLGQIPIFRMFYPDYTFEKCVSQTQIVYINDTYGVNGDIITIPVLAENVKANTISYQFKLIYDSNVLEYVDYNLNSCITNGGNVILNNREAGLCYVSYMTTKAFSDKGKILNLKFKIKDCKASDINVSDFLFNTTKVENIETAKVSVNCLYGDVDVNGYVQAYDAALTLQHSVGFVLHTADKLTWEAWRENLANVDGVGGVSAYDASLILQYSANFITKFPVQNSNKSAQNIDTDVDISIEGDKIVFRSKGDLYGFNIATENSSDLGEPVILDRNMLSATNINDNKYLVGVCTATPAEKGTTFMEIPLNTTQDVTLNLLINNKATTLKLSSLTDENKLDNDIQVKIYPVPAVNTITINGMKNVTEISIYSAKGELKKRELMTKTIDISDLPKGIYLLKIKNSENNIVSKRFVK